MKTTQEVISVKWMLSSFGSVLAERCAWRQESSMVSKHRLGRGRCQTNRGQCGQSMRWSSFTQICRLKLFQYKNWQVTDILSCTFVDCFHPIIFPRLLANLHPTVLSLSSLPRNGR